MPTPVTTRVTVPAPREAHATTGGYVQLSEIQELLCDAQNLIDNLPDSPRLRMVVANLDAAEATLISLARSDGGR